MQAITMDKNCRGHAQKRKKAPNKQATHNAVDRSWFSADYADFLNYWNSKNMEKDNCLSKFNYGLRKHYSIDTTLLEKRLIHNVSMRNYETTIYNMTDLEACYDH